MSDNDSAFLRFLKRLKGDYDLWSSLFAQNKENSELLGELKSLLKDESRTVADLRSQLESQFEDIKTEVESVKSDREKVNQIYAKDVKYLKDNFNYLYLDAFKNRQQVSSWLALVSDLSNKQNGAQDIEDNSYLLLNYFLHNPLYDGFCNLGDYVQTIATKAALSQLCPNPKFSYWDRDSLSFFRTTSSSRIICVMQGWFSHSFSFLPNEKILPIWLGTHFDEVTQKFLKHVLVANPNYFQEDVGCRDLYTLEFCKNFHIPAYFSRCLTLTLPRRTESLGADQVFLVDVPEVWEEYLPKSIVSNAVHIKQRWVNCVDDHWSVCFKRAENLLLRYQREARLVVTTALHCAAPCLAMGIPVVLIQEDSLENRKRFSALKGITSSYTLSELQSRKVNFDPMPVDIEALKVLLLDNLRLSIKSSLEGGVQVSELKGIRTEIENFEASPI